MSDEEPLWIRAPQEVDQERRDALLELLLATELDVEARDPRSWFFDATVLKVWPNARARMATVAMAPRQLRRTNLLAS